MLNFRKQIEVFDFLSPLDWAIFFLVLFLTLAAVFYAHRRRQRNEESDFLDMLLMGRQLTLPMFVATLVATWYGGIFGVTQISFEKGVYNFLTQGVFWYVTYIIFAIFLVPKIASYRAVTLPDLAGKMFGEKSQYLAGAFNFLNVVPVSYAISLGLFLQILFGGSLSWNISLGVFFVAIYSMIGGFRSVVYSDLIQFVVMCSAVFLVVVFSFKSFGGFSFLQEHLPSSHFEPLGGESLATTMVWGLIALSTLVDPNFYQRCFAAKNQRVAKKGILISTLIWMGFDVCTTLGGLYARAVIPGAESGTAYFVYSIQVLPEGLRGFFIAGILATILSTMDSYIFIAGNSLSFDLVPKKWRGRVLWMRLGILLSGIVAISLAGHFEGNIRMVWKTLGSYSAACLLLPMMVGYVFPGKIRDLEFVFTGVAGAIVVTIWRFWERPGFWAEVDELYAGVFSTLLILLVLLGCRFFYWLGGGDRFVKKP